MLFFITWFNSNNFVYIYIYGYVTFAPESITIVGGINKNNIFELYYLIVVYTKTTTHISIGGQR